MIWYNVHLGKNNVKCDKWFPQELGEKYLKADGKRMKLEEKVKKLETRPFKIELRVTSSFEAASSVLPREHGCLLLTSPISPPSSPRRFFHSSEHIFLFLSSSGPQVGSPTERPWYDCSLTYTTRPPVLFHYFSTSGFDEKKKSTDKMLARFFLDKECFIVFSRSRVHWF